MTADTEQEIARLRVCAKSLRDGAHFADTQAQQAEELREAARIEAKIKALEQSE